MILFGIYSVLWHYDCIAVCRYAGVALLLRSLCS